MATDMDALMEALKRAGSSGISAAPGKPVAAKLSVMKAMPMDGMSDDAMGGGSDDSDSSMVGEGDEPTEEDNERNAQIVDTLQTDYPAIFAKISKQVDGAAQSAPSDDTSTSAPPPAGM